MAVKLGIACTGCGVTFKERDEIVPVYDVVSVDSYTVKMQEHFMKAYHIKCFADYLESLK